ncbi:MAG: PQQ-binding-like beta-propeller repeat protein [Planctomycetota bacterium]
MIRTLLCLLILVVGPFTASPGHGQSTRPADSKITIIVMDPLSQPLSCDCVRGYAQRKYQVVADKVSEFTGRKVQIVWHQSLTEALKETDGQADLVVGKHSVVVADANSAGLKLQPVASLTGKDGGTTQHGLVVVRSDDPATELESLSGYDILFGPKEAEEKSRAVRRSLLAAGVDVPTDVRRFGACSEAATALLAMPNDKQAAAVISSYAKPLLEGCGSIHKGELRVVGRSQPVPFITAFLNQSLSEELAESLNIALLTAGMDPRFREQMETLSGFVPWLQPGRKSNSRGHADDTAGNAASAWPQFRGPHRSGIVDWLPTRLPDLDQDLIWVQSLASPGIGGLMLTDQAVIVSGRDADDLADTFTAIGRDDGRVLWQHQHQAPAALDYGNSPRATPVFQQGQLITLGSTGVLTCLDPDTGAASWQVDLAARFGCEVPTWGFCCSPLISDGIIYVQLHKAAPLVALELETGKTLWSGPGFPAAYSSLASTRIGDRKVIIGVDQVGYFARSADDGQHLWNHKRSLSGDFGVPAPVVGEDLVFFAGENNGIEAFELNRLQDGPVMTNPDIAPDCHTPVLVNDTLLVVYQGLHCLDTTRSLQTLWVSQAEGLDDYASLIASPDRVLVTTADSQLLLYSLRTGKQLDRLRLTDSRRPLLSHPIVANGRLIVRVDQEVRCYDLGHQ